MNIAQIISQARERVRVGFPNGADSTSREQIVALVARVNELEKVLIPFARIANAELTTPPVNGNPLVHCYLSDCVSAKKTLDRGVVPPAPPPNFGIPAE